MKRLLATLAVVFLCLPASAAVLYTPHFIQFFDDDGAPCSGCKLYTYTAGTTTPKATYTTEAGSTPNANPVVMDASGRATVFLSGSYKFRLETADGDLIEETDNVTAFSVQSASVDDIVTNFTEVQVASGDSIIFADASDSNTTKRDTIDGVTDVVASTLAGKTDTVILSSDKITFYDASDSNLPKTDTIQGLLDLTISQGTSQATTSGTAINFTSIPAGTKRIVISFAGLSTNGSSIPIFRIGDSGGLETTGYLASSCVIGGSPTSYTVGFPLMNFGDATNVTHGIAVFTLLDAATFTWAYSINTAFAANVSISAGSKSLSAELDQITLTTVNGTDTFDAGKINIQYQ